MSDIQPLPPIGKMSIEQAKKALEESFYFTHPLFCFDFSMDRKAELYDGCAQWIQATSMGWSGTAKTNWIQVYYDPSDPRYTPTPTFNEGFGTRTNESARLARPNYRPEVAPLAESVTYPMRLNAKNATRAIRSRLKEMEWDKISNQLYYHLPVYGGAWVKSEWVEKWDKTTLVPGMDTQGNPLAARCPLCDFKTANTEVPFTALKKAGIQSQPGLITPAGPDTAKIEACPTCENHPPLMPYSMTMDEAQSGTDSLGQPMGTPRAMGDWEISIRSPFGMFPKDLGFDMTSGHVDEWAEQHIEQVDWCYLRYANAKNITDLKPESPTELAKFHPTLGTPDIYGSIIDNKVLRNAVSVKEKHRKPWLELVTDEVTGKKSLKMNEGRSFIVANNVLLFDGPYMKDSASQPGKKVPRVMMDYIQWELRDGGRRLNGMSLWELLFDPQDARNEITAQTQSVRQRMALPIYVGLKSWNLQMATRDGVPGRWAFIDVDPEAPTFRPDVLNNMTIDSGAKAELQDAIDSIGRFANFSQTEKGDVPPGVTAALAIQYLKTFAAEGREPRLARIRATLQRVWEHGLDLMKAFYIEPREVTYEDEDEDGEQKSRMVDWEAIKVDSTVKVEAEADFDDKARNQQVVTDMMGSGLLDMSDPNVRREAARLLELPDELFKKWDVQRQSAEREYLAYREEGLVPIRDPGLDDDQVHYDQHGIDAQSDWMIEQEKIAGWDAALKVLGGMWDMISMQVKFPQPNEPPMCIEDKLKMHWQALLMAAMQAGQYQPPGATPQGPDPNQQKAFQYVLNWHAHMEGHKLAGEMKQQQAQMSPQLAAPGSPNETPSGNVSTPGQPPENQPVM